MSDSIKPGSNLSFQRTAEALRETEQRYRELIENANDIIYTLDFDGNITSINNAAERASGYTCDELLHMKLTQLLMPDSVGAGRQMLDRRLAGEGRTRYEVDARAKDGS